jgi:hypothetical protein
VHYGCDTGAEVAALRGGLGVLSRAEVVQLELPFVGEYNVGAPRFSEGISFMDVVGFSPYDIVEQHRLPTTGKQLFQIDVLFLRKTSPIMQRVQADIDMIGGKRQHG